MPRVNPLGGTCLVTINLIHARDLALGKRWMRRCALCAFLVFCTCALMGCVPVVLGGETVSTVRMTLVDWAGEEIAEPALAIPILRKSDGITVGFFTCQGDIPSGDPYTGRVFVQHSGGLTPIEEPPQKCVLWWPWSVFTSIGIPRAEGIIFVIPGRGCAFAPRCGLRGQSPDGQAIGSASFTRFDDRDGELACLGALLNEDLARSDELGSV